MKIRVKRHLKKGSLLLCLGAFLFKGRCVFCFLTLSVFYFNLITEMNELKGG